MQRGDAAHAQPDQDRPIQREPVHDRAIVFRQVMNGPTPRRCMAVSVAPEIEADHPMPLGEPRHLVLK